ncbi:hypothetical protein BHE97_04140 [Aeromicrobium sp. PE09-221]|uniref:LPXTG cell wall anchor domain-containing protein n=1 Tax=Aeromicrobium sp. PE09-221 TaxID=1898043 RepID=UPI000B3EAA01|nr:LPXTG cell wall anchor domain-containing protein [Aeromicrobium sp. PE09-221]OUZ11704.1 hypothetical protein BHE97_04140 [Aeromicrobium sp. PE09-221]
MRHRRHRERGRYRFAATTGLVLVALLMGSGLLPAVAGEQIPELQTEVPAADVIEEWEAEPAPEPEPVLEEPADPASEPGPDPASEPGPDPASEPGPDPKPKPEPDPAPEPEPEPTAEAEMGQKPDAGPTDDEPSAETDNSAELVAEGIPPGVTRSHWFTVENATRIHALIAARSTDVQARIVSVSGQSSPWAPPGRLTTFIPSAPPVTGSYRLDIRNRSNETVDISYEIFADDVGPVQISAQVTGDQRWLGVTTRLVRADGTPVTGAQVSGTIGDSDGRQYPFEMSDNRDGTYTYRNGNVPDGSYVVGVVAVVDGVEYRTASGGRVVGGAEPPQVLFSLSREPNPRGWYTQSVRADFFALDPDGVDWVRYKVGDDDTGEAAGNHGFVIIDSDGVHEVLGWAMDSWGNVSEPVNRTVRVDTTAPETALNGALSRARVNQGEPATADFSCHDSVSEVESCLIRFGNGEPRESGQPIDTSAAGRLDYEVIAVNGAGLETTTKGHLEVVGDRVPPIVVLQTEPAPNAQGWHNSAVNAVVSAADAQTGVAWIEYRVGDGAWVRVPEDEARFTVDTEGENRILFRAADQAGNVTMDHPRQIDVDTVAPRVVIDSGLDGRVVWQGAMVTASFDCTDEVSGVENCVGSTPHGTAVPTDTLGSHALSVTGTDHAGNVRVARAVYTVVGDDVELPEVTATPLTSPGPGGWWDGDVEVDLVAGGSARTVHWSLGGVSTGEGAADELATVPINTPGVTRLTYWAEDEQGQRGERGELTVSIDDTQPAIELAGVLHSGQTSRGADVSAEFSCVDAESGVDSCLLRFDDGVELMPGERIDASEVGSRGFEVIARNGAGAELTRAGTLVVSTDDTTAPALELTTEPAASNARGWFRRDVTVSIAASDAGSGVAWLEHRVDDGPWVRANGSRVDVPVTGNGVTTIGYRAADVAGNRTGERTREVRLDKAGPRVTVDPSIDGARVEQGAGLTAVFACTDEHSGVDTCVGSMPNGAPLPTDEIGTFELVVTATDRAGNLTRAVAAYTVVPPGVPAASAQPDRPTHRDWWNDEVRITLRTLPETGAATVHWELEGAQSGSGSAERETVVTVSAEGASVLRYWAEDAEGGSGEPVRFDVQIDRTPPEIGYEGLPAGDRPLTVERDSAVVVEAVCSDGGGSGLDSCDSPLVGGMALPTDQLGEFRIPSFAADIAGNETTDELVYRVVDAPVEEPQEPGDPGDAGDPAGPGSPGDAPGGPGGAPAPTGKGTGAGSLPSTGGQATLLGIALATMTLLGGSLLRRERRR